VQRASTFAVSLILAAGIWLPSVRVFFSGDAATRDETREGLLRTQLETWETRERNAIERMRLANGEWDFMSRTFAVLALANLALREPESKDRYLTLLDGILEDTLATEARHGQEHFLLPYVHDRPWVDPSGRSVFVDGEIALMLAARQRVEESPRHAAQLEARITSITQQMHRGPVLSAESYPDECWTFCNTAALAAVRISDSVTGEDHGALLDAWVARAKRDLVDPETGLLVSSYTRDGRHLDGPEGSSIFFAAHALELIDPAFAEDQYTRAREELGAELFGFAWAREWPSSWAGPQDVDSGPVVPVLGASAGASGMALLGAAVFDDEGYLEGLHRSLDLAGFPDVDEEGALRFAASNQVGDAVLLYSLVEGPLWDAARRTR